MHMPKERVSSGGGKFEKLVYPVPWRSSEDKVHGKLDGATRFDPRQICHKKVGFPTASDIVSVWIIHNGRVGPYELSGMFLVLPELFRVA
jgi:hypothetical protein